MDQNNNLLHFVESKDFKSIKHDPNNKFNWLVLNFSPNKNIFERSSFLQNFSIAAEVQPLIEETQTFIQKKSVYSQQGQD